MMQSSKRQETAYDHIYVNLNITFGLVPLVIFPGAGSELYRGIGVVVFGGLGLSTFGTLIIVPPLMAITLNTRFVKSVHSNANLKEVV